MGSVVEIEATEPVIADDVAPEGQKHANAGERP